MDRMTVHQKNGDKSSNNENNDKEKACNSALLLQAL